MMDKNEERNLIKVATLYYKEELTQSEIAKKLGVSRSLVSKWLISARKNGFVEIYFNNSDEVYSIDLENKLEKYLELHSIKVINTNFLTKPEIEKLVGQTAALFLNKILDTKKSIGISWGNTIRMIVKQFPFNSHKDKIFIPLIGGMGRSNFEIHSNQLCYELANKTRSSAKYLYTPALVSNKKIREEFYNNEDINCILEEAKKVDLAIVSICSPQHTNTMEEIGYITQNEIQELKELKVVGDINSRFFDKNGTEVNHMVNTNVIGISIDELKAINQVVAVAYDKNKWIGIYYACKNNLITDLIITDSIAKKIVDYINYDSEVNIDNLV